MDEILDTDILPLCLKHNFWTWSAQSQVQPIPVKKAKGVFFWDINGKRYLDFNSMVMCANIGHGDERVINAIIKQAQELVFAGPHMATKPRAILGKTLAEICPQGLIKFLYTLGGADANENAIKLARSFTGRSKIITRYRSYHGASYGAIALSGDARRLAWEPNIMPGVVHMLDPFKYRSVFHKTHPEISEDIFTDDHLNYLEELIQFEGRESIAAIFLEPVTGTNGIIIPPDRYLQGVRSLCDKYKILLVADEVMTGFGRTGAWFAVNHWGVVPDIMTMAKGLTSAYAPLGAVAMQEEIADFFDNRVFQGGLTYNGHPLSLAAAIANINVIKEDHLVEQSKKSGQVLARLLEEIKNAHASVGDVRSIGLFGAIELVGNKLTRESIATHEKGNHLIKALSEFTRSHGLFHYIHENVILIIPPLIIKEEELEEGFNILSDGIRIIDEAVNN